MAVRVYTKYSSMLRTPLYVKLGLRAWPGVTVQEEIVSDISRSNVVVTQVERRCALYSISYDDRESCLISLLRRADDSGPAQLCRCHASPLFTYVYNTPLREETSLLDVH